MEATATPASVRPSTVELRGHLANALRGPARQARLASWRRMSGSGAIDAVGHPAPGDDRPVLVDGQRLDRRRADVDADGDGLRGRGSRI